MLVMFRRDYRQDDNAGQNGNGDKGNTGAGSREQAKR